MAFSSIELTGIRSVGVEFIDRDHAVLASTWKQMLNEVEREDWSTAIVTVQSLRQGFLDHTERENQFLKMRPSRLFFELDEFHLHGIVLDRLLKLEWLLLKIVHEPKEDELRHHLLVFITILKGLLLLEMNEVDPLYIAQVEARF